jgi:hypothetical protein
MRWRPLHAQLAAAQRDRGAPGGIQQLSAGQPALLDQIHPCLSIV